MLYNAVKVSLVGSLLAEYCLAQAFGLASKALAGVRAWVQLRRMLYVALNMANLSWDRPERSKALERRYALQDLGC